MGKQNRERRPPGICMLTDILGYLNNDQIREVLGLNTVKLKELEEDIKRADEAGLKRDIGATREHRQLIEIRQALYNRLGWQSDRDVWMKM